MDTLSRHMSRRQRVLLVGKPGTGKTARVHAACKAAGMDLVTVCAGIEERVTFSGCYVPDAAAGITRALPLEMLHNLQRTKRPTLLFLDDLGQGPHDVQSAIKSLLTRGGALRDNPNVLVWAATNSVGDQAGANRLLAQLKSEIAHKYCIATPTDDDEQASGGQMLQPWKDEVDHWCDWAMSDGVEADPIIVAWHRFTGGRGSCAAGGKVGPGALFRWNPSADAAMPTEDFRAWEAVIDLYRHGDTDLATVSSTIGKAAAAVFLGFAALGNSIPTPDQIRMDPKGAPVPTEPGALWLISTTLEMAAGPRDGPAFCKYWDRLPRVFGALAAIGVYRKLGPIVSGCAEYTRWFRENQQLFSIDSAKKR